MILITASPEFLTDIFTPGVFNPNECVEGLPEGCELLSIVQDDTTGLIIFSFDDGKEEESVVTVKYNAVFASPGVV